MDLGFADLKSFCKFLTGKSIRVLSFLEGFLELLNLFWSKLGSVSSLVQSAIVASAASAAAAASFTAITVSLSTAVAAAATNAAISVRWSPWQVA